MSDKKFPEYEKKVIFPKDLETKRFSNDKEYGVPNGGSGPGPDPKPKDNSEK